MIVIIGKWLGRKFISCVIAQLLIVVGAQICPPGNFGIACAAIVTLALGFMGSNTAAGALGQPGPPVKDTQDGGDRRLEVTRNGAS